MRIRCSCAGCLLDRRRWDPEMSCSCLLPHCQPCPSWAWQLPTGKTRGRAPGSDAAESSTDRAGRGLSAPCAADPRPVPAARAQHERAAQLRGAAAAARHAGAARARRQGAGGGGARQRCIVLHLSRARAARAGRRGPAGAAGLAQPRATLQAVPRGVRALRAGAAAVCCRPERGWPAGARAWGPALTQRSCCGCS